MEAPWGTLFISRKLTSCPLCYAPISPLMLAVMTSWTKRDRRSSLARGGLSGAIHVECAERYGIEVRWSVPKILGDLRRSIATIQRRRVRMK